MTSPVSLFLVSTSPRGMNDRELVLSKYTTVFINRVAKMQLKNEELENALLLITKQKDALDLDLKDAGLRVQELEYVVLNLLPHTILVGVKLLW